MTEGDRMTHDTYRLGRASLLAVLLAFAACSALANDVAQSCDVTAEKAAVVDASGASGAEVTARAGSLEIVGRPDLSAVRVRGRACATEEELLEEIELTARRDGDRIEVKVTLPDDLRGRAWLDLTVEIPEGMDLDVEDSSGDATIRDVGALTVRDGSGDLRVENAGDLEIDDGSGEVFVERVGSLRLDDRSGDVRAVTIRGDAHVEDGSGELFLQDVGGSVCVDDGSGPIRVVRVSSDLSVVDGSGDLEIRDVKGSVRVDDGSGDISVGRVLGSLSIVEAGSGDLEIEQIRGAVKIGG